MEQAPLWGINHLKLPATDILSTKDFYCHIMGCEYLPHYDHYDKQGRLFAIMFEINHSKSSKIIVEVRKSPEHARAQVGWDPITFGVRTRADLETWKAWFEMKGIKCSKVFRGLKGWVSCALDPDGKIVRLYCDEEHEWDSENFDEDEFWLGSPSGNTQSEDSSSNRENLINGTSNDPGSNIAARSTGSSSTSPSCLD